MKIQEKPQNIYEKPRFLVDKARLYDKFLINPIKVFGDGTCI